MTNMINDNAITAGEYYLGTNLKGNLKHCVVRIVLALYYTYNQSNPKISQFA